MSGAGYDLAMAKPGPKPTVLDDPIAEAKRARDRERFALRALQQGAWIVK